MKLHELRDNPGATRLRKRVGRGPGSGRGKTAGRGMKGQKSRSGVSLAGFEGGQMPLYQRMPKRGFRNPNGKRHAIVGLGQLQTFIDSGRIDASQMVDEAVLLSSGLVRRLRDGVRVLANGAITTKVDLAVTGASKAAIAQVEAAGGRLTIMMATRDQGVSTAEELSADEQADGHSGDADEDSRAG